MLFSSRNEKSFLYYLFLTQFNEKPEDYLKMSDLKNFC